MAHFFDSKRPAADGKWVAIHPTPNGFIYTTHKTEDEAKAAVEASNG